MAFSLCRSSPSWLYVDWTNSFVVVVASRRCGEFDLTLVSFFLRFGASLAPLAHNFAADD
jgi:hypothetical protein